ncbi:MAG: methyltransferase domain-containing protein [Candidatus Rokuibacteriota bacterium]
MQRSTSAGLISLLLLAAGCAPHPASDVPFLVTPPEIVEQMLRLARVGPGDVVYDLGSGDGRLVIAAARDFRAGRAVGVEIDPGLVARSREYAREAGVADRVIFIEQDFFEADLSAATVVTLYLTREVNLRLRPKLERELAPGARVVSFNFDMGDWEPASMLRVDVSGRATPVYLWVVKPR